MNAPACTDVIALFERKSVVRDVWRLNSPVEIILIVFVPMSLRVR